MMHLMHSRRLRKTTSIIASFAMVIGLITIPAFAAPTPTVPANLAAGTTGITSIDGTGAAGLLGTYSFEVSGTPATRANVRSDALWATAQRAAKLADLNVSADASAKLKIFIDLNKDGDTADVNETDTVVPNLTNQSTVQDVVNAINAGFGTWVTAYFIEPAGKIQMDATYIGDVALGVYDEFAITDIPRALGMADAVFGGTTRLAGQDWANDSGATLGTGYVNYRTRSGYGDNTATFTPVGGAAYSVATTLGSSIGGSGAFQSVVDTSTGFYTAVKITTAGHGFTLKTAGRNAGLGNGVASFDGVNGVRSPEFGTIIVTQGDPITDHQAGVAETITVSVPTTVTGGAENALNGIKVALPVGFSFNASTTPIFSMAASVTIAGSEITVDKFVKNADGDPVQLQVGVINATTKSSATLVYPLTVSTRNVGGTAYTLGKTQNLTVLSKNVVASTTAVATEINAGGYSEITAKIFDQYGNEITEWGHSWTSSISASPAPTGTISPAGLVATATPASPKTFTLRTSTTPGVNTVALRVDESTATANNVAVSVDTANVGAPYQVLVYTRQGTWTFPATATPEFYVKIVDQTGKGTSFLTDKSIRVKQTRADGGTSYADVTIPAGYSTSTEADDVDFGSPGMATAWQINAVDLSGAVKGSPVQTVSFRPTGIAYRLKIVAEKQIPGEGNWNSDEQILNDDNYYAYGWFTNYQHYFSRGAFGYANPDGTDSVQFTAQLVDVQGNPVALPGQVVTMTVVNPGYGNWTGSSYNWVTDGVSPGVLSSNVATTDASGKVVVTLKSFTSSEEHRYRLRADNNADTGYVDNYYGAYNDRNNYWYYGSDAGLSSWLTPVSFETTIAAANQLYDYGFGYFPRAVLRDLTAEPEVIMNDGVARTKITARYHTQGLLTPAIGATINFATTAGSLSATQAVTDANGDAVVYLTGSATADRATVTVTDAEGNSGSNWSSGSIEVRFTDVQLRVENVTNNVQAGYQSYALVRLTVVKADGSRVYWTPGSFDVDTNGIYFANGDYTGYYPDFEAEETATVGGQTMGAAVVYRVYGGASGQALLTGERTTLFDDASYRVGSFEKSVAGEAVATVNFVNNATLTATKYAMSGVSNVTGSGFFHDDDTDMRDIPLYVGQPGEALFEHIGYAYVDINGAVYQGYIYNLPYLSNGTYGVWADGNFFPNALTVTGLSATTASIVGISSNAAAPTILKNVAAPLMVSVSDDVDDIVVKVDGVSVGQWSWAGNNNQGGSIFTVPWNLFSASLYPGTAHTITVIAYGNDDVVTTGYVSLYNALPKTRTSMALTAPTTATRGAAFTATAKITPAMAKSVKLYAYKWVSGRGWVLQKAWTGTTSAAGVKAFRQSLPTAGRWALRVKFFGDSGNTASNSPYRYVTVR